ncbi:MAG TPA: sigma-E factor negative regulatory protein [Rudaea sp.]|jgi:sigma-E factor negative regulatory protein RseA|nr:sigma-E factor negative regulatory protein [Rudaea sp.]
MNETANEQLSALMDGELPRDELRFLLRGLGGDAGLAQRWSRYQIARAVLQHEYVPAATGDDRFAAAVMLRLEPVQPRLGRRIGRWAGGGAIAAAVAVVALMATRPAGENGALPAPGTDLAAATPMLLSPQQPVARQQQPVFAPMPAMPATFSDTQPASFESFLPRYTTNPRGSAQNADATPNGFVPYILMIGSRPKAEVSAAAGQDAPPPPPQQ